MVMFVPSGNQEPLFPPVLWKSLQLTPLAFSQIPEIPNPFAGSLSWEA